ncbi:hypothetical protein [Natronosalvus caseinilyticus]|uniref:hypothetical protein n=1 Tax=Natronosalvus caseinilyticus TaxID=2953747 RepID=UPI0028A9543A|nr:hypothetical protein [Natronosalvus caseinilyticus]
MTTTTHPIPAFAPTSGNAGVATDADAAGTAGRCVDVAGWGVTGVSGRYGVSMDSGVAGPKGRGRALGHPTPISSNLDGISVRAA